MSQISTVLFDFDGVIVDTEPQYDIFSNQLAERYKHLPDNFAQLCRGVTLNHILDIHFDGFSEDEKAEIRKESDNYELEIEYPWIPGAKEFIEYLKLNNYKVGLVTSSPDFKMEIALKQLKLEGVFDTEVTANRITEGKPNPMCYLLAAKDLGVDPHKCIVFEDSFFGIKSGSDAGMRVVGLSTSFDKEELQDITYAVIPNFEDLEKVKSFLE